MIRTHRPRTPGGTTCGQAARCEASCQGALSAAGESTEQQQTDLRHSRRRDPGAGLLRHGDEDEDDDRATRAKTTTAGSGAEIEGLRKGTRNITVGK